jgi:hypothetical protein
MPTHRSTASRSLLKRAGYLLAVLLVGIATATAAPAAEDELVKLGFKVLVATNEVQRKWISDMPPGAIRAMQRTGKKFFIYPDAARGRVFVGGPVQYAAYTKAHPEELVNAERLKYEAVADAERNAKDTAAVEAANQRDLTDPFLGLTLEDLVF